MLHMQHHIEVFNTQPQNQRSLTQKIALQVLYYLYQRHFVIFGCHGPRAPPPLQTGGGGVRPRGPSPPPPLTCVCTTYINFYILFSPPLSVRHYYLYFSNLPTLSLSNLGTFVFLRCDITLCGGHIFFLSK